MKDMSLDGRELLKNVLRERLNVKKRIDLSTSKGLGLGYSWRYVNLMFVSEGDKIDIPLKSDLRGIKMNIRDFGMSFGHV